MSAFADQIKVEVVQQRREGVRIISVPGFSVGIRDSKAISRGDDVQRAGGCAWLFERYSGRHFRHCDDGFIKTVGVNASRRMFLTRLAPEDCDLCGMRLKRANCQCRFSGQICGMRSSEMERIGMLG